MGENWKEFCEEFIANFPNTNPNYVFKRLLRTGFISEEIETANEEIQAKPQEEKKTEKQQSETFESDQSKMIKDLFDGKYIN